MFQSIDALLVCLVVLVLLGVPIFGTSERGLARLQAEQDGVLWFAYLGWRTVYWLAVVLLFFCAAVLTWAAFYNPDLLILAVLLDGAATYWVTRRLKAKRRKLNPTEKMLAEISAGGLSEKTRREFEEWSRQESEAAKRRYEESLAQMREDAEELRRERVGGLGRT
jgi:hypothetical protein